MQSKQFLVAIGVALVIVTGCTSAPPLPSPSGQASPRPSSAASAPPGQASPSTATPSRARLVQQAVAAGSVDQVTGLVYRALSTLGFAGMPVQYSTGVLAKDDGVFADIVTLMSTLSTSDQARVTPFVARPTSAASVFGPNSNAESACKAWVDSGTRDARFKVWACSDDGSQQAQNDVANATALIKPLWDSMTTAEPAGMGIPLGDAYGSDPAAYGGDDRIDVYLVNLGQGFASAVPAPPYTNADGSSARTSSGYILLNSARLAAATTKSDIVHELFHVLEWSHNLLATHDKGEAHWFDEASATWAETYFYPDGSAEAHQLFPEYFQTSDAGLESADIDHQYASYIWPFFMQQELGEKSIFQAWASMDTIAQADFDGVTAAINAQLPFDENFREFAVRNLDLDDVLQTAGLPTYDDADANFQQNSPPAQMVEASIAPGAPYESEAGPAAPLDAGYWHFSLDPTAKLVSISVFGVAPQLDMDADVLLRHSSGKWERRKLNGSEIKFCRDDPGQDIDALYLIVSGHSTIDSLTGSIEATASTACSGAPMPG